jgi:hypothetical protein
MPEPESRLERKHLPRLFHEFTELGKEIAQEGDIP